MFQNQNNGLVGGGGGGSGGTTTPNPTGASLDPTQHPQQAQPPLQQQNMNYNGMPQQQQQQQQVHITKNLRKKPYVKITEQPASKALRFRYECEGRSAGSIPGVNSTPENKTYPTIEIVGYKGRAVVVVSCVTKDMPYRPHPHNLVGKEGCKKGVCTLEINSETMRAVFSNLGIQCVKKKDIDAALKAREDIRVDPYKTGFSHRFQPTSIDLNAVRLCFQVFMEGEKGRFTQPLAPVVSEPIFDKKAMSDLVICRLCTCSASVLGNTQIILLCEKVAKEDIAVKFFEEKNGRVVWEAYGDFQHTDVHKQTAITFKTPKYHTIDITEPAKVFIQLKRPSDGITSEPLEFEYVPLESGRYSFWNLRRTLKRKPDDDIFQEILAAAGEKKPAVTEVIDLDTPTAEQQVCQVFSNVLIEEDTEAAKRRKENEIDAIIDEKVRELEQQEQEHKQQEQLQLQQQQHQEQLKQEQLQQQQQQLQQQQLQHQEQLQQQQQQQQLQQQQLQQQEQLQQQQPQVAPQVAFIADQQPELSAPPAPAPAPTELSVNDKINEWMNSNELQQTEPRNAAAAIAPAATDEDKALNDLLEQAAELDEIYSRHVCQRDNYNSAILNELNEMETCVPDPTVTIDDGQTNAMDVEDSFDDAATYSSLQKAFKNPIDIPVEDLMPPTPPASQLAPEDAQHYDHIEVLSDPTANGQFIASPVSAPSPQQQSPPRPVPPKFGSPHMHVTAAEEEKLPPLPPKRIRKQDSNAENRSIEANSGDHTERRSRTPAPIIIMKSPDHSPPFKRLPPKPGSGSLNTLPKQKKPGFFSKLFSRRKSKSDLSGESSSRTGSKISTPNGSREPSIGHFNMNDSNRASVKSLQPISRSASGKAPKQGRPVGRSVSSVSGKRPAHLDAAVIHIPLKGDSVSSLPQHEAYSHASTITLSNTLDRKTVSALQLADIPICDGNMELVAIADRQSLRNLCEGEFNVQLDPNVDLTEAEHFALYTSIPPQATASEFDDQSAYYASVDAGEILTPDEIAKRLAAANSLNNNQSAYYASVDAGEILTPDEIAKRLAAANSLN